MSEVRSGVERLRTPVRPERRGIYGQDEPTSILAQEPMPSPEPALSRMPVILAPALGEPRPLELTVPPGATLAEIVVLATPHLPAVRPDDLRVILATEADALVVPRDRWARVRPRPGVKVAIRVVARGQMLRSILMIVVTIAAVALGQLWAPALVNATGLSTAMAASLITAGLSITGALLVNALVPLAKPKKEKEQYTISGFRNQANPDGAIPAPLGRLRMAPYYAAPPYSEMVGDIQYVRVLFVWGYGPLAISDLKLGDTPLADFDEVQIETRQGFAGDDPITLYPQQVIEEPFAVELTRKWQRKDNGDYLPGGTTIEKPVVRYTATDTSEAAVIVAFPAGLVHVKSDGKFRNHTVVIRIRQRPIGAEIWSEVATLAIVARQTRPFWRQHRWTLPSRGAYEIEVTRMTDEAKSSKVSDRSVWQALQSFRPEYPLNFDRPLALTALRIKATEQIHGQLDNLSGIASRIAADWDAATGTWVTRETRSPAAAMRWILQGPAAAYPEEDASIDLDQLADWSEWCELKGLRYDAWHDQDGSLGDALAVVCAAGRATPRHDGRRWGVVIDRPQTLVVDHITPRNARDFQWSRTYVKKPDGFRAKFVDASNDYKMGERIVPWHDHTGDVVVTEALEFPGKTDPDEIWIEARRRQYEIDHRPDTFRATQDGAARVATRGDLVALSYDVLDRALGAGRVAAVVGRRIVLDEEMTVGEDWAMRFRVFADADDVIGSSVVVAITSGPGTGRAVTIADGATPRVGDIVIVGPRTRESLMARVRAEERGEDGAVILHLVAAAPEIDELTDAEVPPAWDGRVGSPGPVDITPPVVPVITSIISGLDATGDADGIEITLQPGLGSAIGLRGYEVDHRPVGGAWVTETFSAADGGGPLPGHAKGDEVEILGRAISLVGIASNPTDTVTIIVGEGDLIVPVPVSLTVTVLATTKRRYTVKLPASTETVQIVGYRLRARPGTAWAWDDMAPLVDGYLTSSPVELADPRPAGTWTIAAIAVGSTGLESAAVSLEIAFTAASDLLASRIERALGWSGAISGGSVVASDLVATDTTASTVTYTTPIIDLGADHTVTVEAEPYGFVGVATLTMKTGLDAGGGTLGGAGPLGAVTARHVQLICSVSSSAQARLGDLVTTIHT